MSIKGSSYPASPFSLDCFIDSAVISVPSRAPVTVGMQDRESASAQLAVSNFPAMLVQGDVKVSFGGTLCGAPPAACSIQGFRNVDSGVVINVTIPPSAVAGPTVLRVEFTGSPAAPRWGDAALAYNASSRVATTTFTYYVPAPSVSASMWCSRCVEYDWKSAIAPCIRGGKCGGGIPPLEGIMPATGGGTLTLLVDDAPMIPVDQDSGALLSPAVAAVHFGPAIGAFIFPIRLFRPPKDLAKSISIHSVKNQSSDSRKTVSLSLSLSLSFQALFSDPPSQARVEHQLKQPSQRPQQHHQPP